MTAPEPMTRTELLELAALDALGLLDEYEAALYTRSFHDASASVQDEVRELQAQIAVQLGQMSDEEPSPELRDRVLKAVSKAIELDSPAPLASIGRGAGDYDPEFDGEVGQRDPAVAGPASERRLIFSGQIWRAASFVLLGVVVVCVFGLVHIWRLHNDLTLAAVSSNTHEQLERMIGPTVKDYLRESDTVRIVFTSEAGACEDCWANLLILEGTDEALFISEGLPELDAGQSYQLRVRHDDGRVATVERITTGTMLAGQRITVELTNLVAGATWELAGPDGVILTGSRV